MGDVECIDAIRSALGAKGFMNYLTGNVMKYLWRHRFKKKPLEDLKKAQFYLNRLVKEMEEYDKADGYIHITADVPPVCPGRTEP